MTRTYREWKRIQRNRRHHRYRYNSYRHSYRPRGHSLGKILIIAFVAILVGVMYLLLFNPALPKSVLTVLSPIIYITEFIILILGLLLLNGFGLGRSDLGVWGFGILSVVLIGLGVFFFFGSGFVPRVYLGYDAWFGVVLGILGIFAGFRARRRYGTFVYMG